MNVKSKLNRVAIAVAVSVGLSTSAMAQVTTSGMTGQIVGPQGYAAVGTEVTIVHEPSGSRKTATVNSAGQFNAKGLRVGGPYTITFASNKFENRTLENVYIALGETLPLNVALQSESDIEVISVTAGQLGSADFGRSSPAANFDLSDLQNVPAINRSLNDVVRSDPRLFVDESGGDGIQCAGKSPRFNSLTVDGVRQNDLFGLNGNGFPTERQPFPFDAIQGVTVEFAPFEVIYGGFTACNINAVTKSGTNEVHGSAFFDYTNDDLRGDSLEGDDINFGNFTEKRYGFEIGAPLIKDKLFIYAAYEKLEGANLFARGASDSDALNQVDITQAQLDEIVQISQDLYNYDPGQIPTSLDNEDEKIFVKLDWNINDQHRASLGYSYNDGNNFVQSDGDSDEFEFQNHLYERGAEFTSYVGSFYSDWTDKFSTEVRLNYIDVDNRQNSLAGDGTVGGNDFGEVQVDVGDVTVYLGSDDSRQANDLNYDVFSLILRGFYYFDSGHNLTFGYERDDLNIFNLFIQHTEGELRFDSIDDFRNGFASRVEFNGIITGDADVQGDLSDGAADWSYVQNAAYVSDEFYLTDDLKVTGGLRYEWYTSSDRPDLNQEFLDAYGFGNDATLDGLGLLQPRLGFNYTVSDATEVRGGLGLFSGGNPNVWVSNSFSNTNTIQTGVRGRNFGFTDGSRSLFDDDVVYLLTEDTAPVAGPGFGIPEELVEAARLGNGSNFEINYLDPDFDIPKEWKAAVGLTHETENGVIYNADIIYSIFQDSAITLAGDLEETGQFTEEGYIIYDSVRPASFVLTNSDVDADALSISGSVSRSFDNGFQITFGYNYNDAEDVNPQTSSVAFSNFHNRAFTNPNEQVASTSDFNIEHRFTLDLRYTKEFFAGLETRVALFGFAQSGKPFSLTRSQGEGNDIFGFTPFINGNSVLAIGDERNSETNPWWSKLDLSVYQEVPAFSADHSANVFFIIDNFTNLLNDDWGILEETPSNVSTTGTTFRDGDVSAWSMRIGVNYRF